MTDTENAKALDALDANALIVRLATKHINEIGLEVKKLHKSQQYLIMGRILQFMFTRHFRPSIDASEKMIDKNEK